MATNTTPPMQVGLDAESVNLILEGIGNLPASRAGILYTNINQAWQSHLDRVAAVTEAVANQANKLISDGQTSEVAKPAEVEVLDPVK